MTRRELMKLANALALGSVPGTLSVLNAESRPTLAIVEFKGVLKDIPQCDRVKVIVVGDEAQLTFFDEEGEVCTKDVIREVTRGYTVK